MQIEGSLKILQIRQLLVNQHVYILIIVLFQVMKKFYSTSDQSNKEGISSRQ